MIPAAPLPPLPARAPGLISLVRRLALLLAALWLLPPSAPAAQVETNHLELVVQIDPGLQALYAKAHLEVQNRGDRVLDVLALEFPTALGPRLQVNTVWDRDGELGWRFDPVEEDVPRTLLVALRSPLSPGKKLLVVVSYDLQLKDFTLPETGLEVSPQSARLPTTGWYPAPSSLRPAMPRTLRLTVRLPKQWRVEAPLRLKRLHDGTTLASYELELKRVEPGQLLFHASSTGSP